MKNDKSGFWKAICEDPDDDVPRLVFADYLDEQGHPERAELIRAQCDLEALPISEPRRIDLEMTSRWLLQEYQHLWNEELPQWIDRDTVRFRRGFPSRIETSPLQFDKNRSALAKRTAIQQIDVNAAMGSIMRDRIEQSGLLPRLRGFRNNGRQYDEISWMLKRLTGLRDLSLEWPRASAHNSASQLEKLLDLSNIRRITSLRFALPYSDFDSTSVPLGMVIADAPWDKLKHLCLSLSSASSETERALLMGPIMKRIQTLEVVSSHSAPLIEALPRLSHLRALKILFQIGSSSQTTIEKLAPCHNLRSLSLLALANEDLRPLTQSPMMDHLTDLELNRAVNRLANDRVEELIRSGRLTNLRRLTIATENANLLLPTIVKSNLLPNLRHLVMPTLEPSRSDVQLVAESNIKTLTVTEQAPPAFDNLKRDFLPELRLMRWSYSLVCGSRLSL